MEHFVVYGLADPITGELRYIGKSTTGVARRLGSHMCASSLRGKTRKNNWLKSLIRRGLKPEAFVIEAFDSKSPLNESERHQIAAFKMMGARLTNGTIGGDGQGGPCPPARREKIAAAQRGKPRPKWSAERRRRPVSVAHLQTPEARKASANARRGVARPPHVIEAMRLGREKYWKSDANRSAQSRSHGGRPFVDQTGRRYETQQGAARELGLPASQINRVLKGLRPSARGFTFTYAEAAP